MLLIGGSFCTSIFVVLLAALFGDLSPQIAAGLISGLIAVAIGLLIPTWPTIVRNLTEPVHATRSARQFNQTATTLQMWVLAFALAAGGGMAILTSLRALAS